MKPLFFARKYLSHLLILTLFSTHVLWAYSPETNFWKQRQQAASAQTKKQPKIPETRVRAVASIVHELSPHGFGADIFLPPKKTVDTGNPIVIYIQDIHGNIEAQKNIGKMILKVLNRHPNVFVGLEGASGRIPIDLYRDPADQRANQRIGRFLLEKGLITGGEYAGFASQAPPFLFGLEEKNLYLENVRAVKHALTRQEKIRNRIKKDRLNSGTIEKLVDLQMTRDEWAKYSRSKYGKYLSPFERFYELAQERDHSLGTNLIKHMSPNPSNISIIVAGGFHAHGITQLLKRKNVTLISLVPKFNIHTNSGPHNYLNTFTGEKTPLEKHFKTPQISIQPTLATHPIYGNALNPKRVRAASKTLTEPPAEKRSNGGSSRSPLLMTGASLTSVATTLFLFGLSNIAALVFEGFAFLMVAMASAGAPADESRSVAEQIEDLTDGYDLSTGLDELAGLITPETLRNQSIDNYRWIFLNLIHLFTVTDALEGDLHAYDSRVLLPFLNITSEFGYEPHQLFNEFDAANQTARLIYEGDVMLLQAGRLHLVIENPFTAPGKTTFQYHYTGDIFRKKLDGLKQIESALKNPPGQQTGGPADTVGSPLTQTPLRTRRGRITFGPIQFSSSEGSETPTPKPAPNPKARLITAQEFETMLLGLFPKGRKPTPYPRANTFSGLDINDAQLATFFIRNPIREAGEKYVEVSPIGAGFVTIYTRGDRLHVVNSGTGREFKDIDGRDSPAVRKIAQYINSHNFTSRSGFSFAVFNFVIMAGLIYLMIPTATNSNWIALFSLGVGSSLFFAAGALFFYYGLKTAIVMFQASPDTPLPSRIRHALLAPIASSDGYRSPAFEGLPKSFFKQMIERHESYDNHWVGMLAMIPLVSNLLPNPGVSEAAGKIRSHIHDLINLAVFIDGMHSLMKTDLELDGALLLIGNEIELLIKTLAPIAEDYIQACGHNDEIKILRTGSEIISKRRASYERIKKHFERLDIESLFESNGDVQGGFVTADDITELRDYVIRSHEITVKAEKELRGIPKKLTPQNLATLLDQYSSWWGGMIPNATLNITNNSSEAEIQVDPIDFARVAQNLVLNSNDAFSREDKADGRIDLVGAIDGNHAKIVVEDNGPGIDEELLRGRKLFKFGHSSKTDGQDHGIGLWYAEKTVKSWGGRIEATNRPENGAQFTIWIPLAQSEPEQRTDSHNFTSQSGFSFAGVNLAIVAGLILLMIPTAANSNWVALFFLGVGSSIFVSAGALFFYYGLKTAIVMFQASPDTPLPSRIRHALLAPIASSDGYRSPAFERLPEGFFKQMIERHESHSNHWIGMFAMIPIPRFLSLFLALVFFGVVLAYYAWAQSKFQPVLDASPWTLLFISMALVIPKSFLSTLFHQINKWLQKGRTWREIDWRAILMRPLLSLYLSPVMAFLIDAFILPTFFGGTLGFPFWLQAILFQWAIIPFILNPILNYIWGIIVNGQKEIDIFRDAPKKLTEYNFQGLFFWTLVNMGSLYLLNIEYLIFGIIFKQAFSYIWSIRTVTLLGNGTENRKHSIFIQKLEDKIPPVRWYINVTRKLYGWKHFPLYTKFWLIVLPLGVAARFGYLLTGQMNSAAYFAIVLAIIIGLSIGVGALILYNWPRTSLSDRQVEELKSYGYTDDAIRYIKTNPKVVDSENGNVFRMNRLLRSHNWPEAVGRIQRFMPPLHPLAGVSFGRFYTLVAVHAEHINNDPVHRIPKPQRQLAAIDSNAPDVIDLTSATRSDRAKNEKVGLVPLLGGAGGRFIDRSPRIDATKLPKGVYPLFLNANGPLPGHPQSLMAMALLSHSRQETFDLAHFSFHTQDQNTDFVRRLMATDPNLVGLDDQTGFTLNYNVAYGAPLLNSQNGGVQWLPPDVLGLDASSPDQLWRRPTGAIEAFSSLIASGQIFEWAQAGVSSFMIYNDNDGVHSQGAFGALLDAIDQEAANGTEGLLTVIKRGEKKRKGGTPMRDQKTGRVVIPDDFELDAETKEVAAQSDLFFTNQILLRIDSVLERLGMTDIDFWLKASPEDRMARAQSLLDQILPTPDPKPFSKGSPYVGDHLARTAGKLADVFNLKIAVVNENQYMGLKNAGDPKTQETTASLERQYQANLQSLPDGFSPVQAAMAVYLSFFIIDGTPPWPLERVAQARQDQEAEDRPHIATISLSRDEILSAFSPEMMGVNADRWHQEGTLRPELEAAFIRFQIERMMIDLYRRGFQLSLPDYGFHLQDGRFSFRISSQDGSDEDSINQRLGGLNAFLSTNLGGEVQWRTLAAEAIPGDHPQRDILTLLVEEDHHQTYARIRQAFDLFRSRRPANVNFPYPIQVADSIRNVIMILAQRETEDEEIQLWKAFLQTVEPVTHTIQQNPLKGITDFLADQKPDEAEIDSLVSQIMSSTYPNDLTQQLPAASQAPDSGKELVVVLKPPHGFKKEVVAEILRRVAYFGYSVVGTRVIDGRTFHRDKEIIGNFYKDHYSGYHEDAITPELLDRVEAVYDKPGFAAEYGEPFNKEMVIAAHQLETEFGLTWDEVGQKWNEIRDQHEVQTGNPVGMNRIRMPVGKRFALPMRLKDRDGNSRLVVAINGHVPTLFDLFMNPPEGSGTFPKTIFLHLHGQKEAVSLKDLRHQFHGANNPENAIAGSIRGDAVTGEVPVDRPDILNVQRNVTHISDNPLESMSDTSSIFGIPLVQTAMGRLLLHHGYSMEQIQRLADDFTVELPGETIRTIHTHLHSLDPLEAIEVLLELVPPEPPSDTETVPRDLQSTFAIDSTWLGFGAGAYFGLDILPLYIRPFVIAFTIILLIAAAFRINSGSVRLSQHLKAKRISSQMIDWTQALARRPEGENDQPISRQDPGIPARGLLPGTGISYTILGRHNPSSDGLSFLSAAEIEYPEGSKMGAMIIHRDPSSTSIAAWSHVLIDENTIPGLVGTGYQFSSSPIFSPDEREIYAIVSGGAERGHHVISMPYDAETRKAGPPRLRIKAGSLIKSDDSSLMKKNIDIAYYSKLSFSPDGKGLVMVLEIDGTEEPILFEAVGRSVLNDLLSQFISVYRGARRWILDHLLISDKQWGRRILDIVLDESYFHAFRKTIGPRDPHDAAGGVFDLFPDLQQDLIRRMNNEQAKSFLLEIFLPFLLNRAKQQGFSLRKYARYLRKTVAFEEREELRLIFSRSLTAVGNDTEFFRDHQLWHTHLVEHVDFLLEEKWKNEDLTVRTRHASGSYGSEAFTTAIIIHRSLERLHHRLLENQSIGESFEAWLARWNIQIDTFDFYPVNLLRVAEGIYEDYEFHRVADAGYEPKKYFQPDADRFRINKTLHQWVQPIFLDLNEPEHRSLLQTSAYDMTFSNVTIGYLANESDKLDVLDCFFEGWNPAYPHVLVFRESRQVPPLVVRYEQDGQWALSHNQGLTLLQIDTWDRLQEEENEEFIRKRLRMLGVAPIENARPILTRYSGSSDPSIQVNADWALSRYTARRNQDTSRPTEEQRGRQIQNAIGLTRSILIGT